MSPFIFGSFFMWCLVFGVTRSDSVTTAVATNIESTIGTPALLIDPTTSINNQNTTDAQYETILKITPLSNGTNDSNEATTLQTTTIADVDLTAFTLKKPSRNSSDAATEDNEYDELASSPQSRQSNPLGFLVNRAPCECRNGVCGCCTGMLVSALRQVGCLNITYSPEDFSFEFKMIMNNAVLYKNRVTGRNPPPVCVRIPRLSFLKMCASFYDLYFVGRNMHVCLEMGAYFRDSEIFNRSFNCMRIGDQGVKVVSPEDGGLFHKPGTDAVIDAGFDDIEDYDENAVVRRRKNVAL